MIVKFVKVMFILQYAYPLSPTSIVPSQSQSLESSNPPPAFLSTTYANEISSNLSPIFACASDAIFEGKKTPLLSSTSCAVDQLPNPKIICSPKRSASSPSKASGPSSLIPLIEDIGGPAFCNSGYSKDTLFHKSFVEEEMARISNG